MIILRMNYFYNKTNEFLRLIINISLILVFFIIISCNFFTRFRHEKYECPYNNLKIQEIIINKEKVGSEIVLIQNNENLKLKITESSKSKILSDGKEFKIEINRKNGEIRFFKQKSYKSLKCKKTLLKF